MGSWRRALVKKGKRQFSGEMIQIDGSYLEGGGQILRTSLTLSALLQREFEISGVRANRNNPGLQAQHLTAVKAMQRVCNAKVEGTELHSTKLKFSPSEIKGGKYIIDVSEVKASAGSAGLIFQALYLPLILTENSHIVLRGGTHVKWAPCFEYLKEIFLPVINRMGFGMEMGIKKYGWYPEGGGEMHVKISKAEKLMGIDLTERGELKRIEGVSIVSNLPEEIAKRQKSEALKGFVNFNCGKKILISTEESIGKGTMLFLKAEHENSVAGFFSLGEIGKKAEEVGREAAEELIEFEKSKGAIDVHLADQLLLPAVFAKGKTKFTTNKISKHLLTNAYTIKQFLPEAKIEVDETEGVVEVKGIDYLGTGRN